MPPKKIQKGGKNTPGAEEMMRKIVTEYSLGHLDTQRLVKYFIREIIKLDILIMEKNKLIIDIKVEDLLYMQVILRYAVAKNDTERKKRILNFTKPELVKALKSEYKKDPNYNSEKQLVNATQIPPEAVIDMKDLSESKKKYSDSVIRNDYIIEAGSIGKDHKLNPKSLNLLISIFFPTNFYDPNYTADWYSDYGRSD